MSDVLVIADLKMPFCNKDKNYYATQKQIDGVSTSAAVLLKHK